MKTEATPANVGSMELLGVGEPDAWLIADGPHGLAMLREVYSDTPGRLPYYTAAQVCLAVNAERERCAAYCGELAEIMECGAGELGLGQRLRQAEQTIRAGRHWTPNV